MRIHMRGLVLTLAWVSLAFDTTTHAALVLGTWQTGAAMPTARAQEVTVTDPLSGNVYVAGGYNLITDPPNGLTGPSLNTLDVYHPATNTWTSATPMPLGVRGAERRRPGRRPRRAGRAA